MIGTAVTKSGMESVTLGMPLLALSAFGGFSAVAGLVVAYGLAQTVFAGMSEGLAARFQARKVLAGAVAAQAALVSVLVGVVAAGALSAATMIPLYLLIGGMTGIIETTRHSIPPLLVGKSEDALESYNAKLHIWYQVAGVAGAVGAGLLIGFGGPVWALAIQPPAYALAAWLFWRVSHAAPAAAAPSPRRSPASVVASYFRDLKSGAKLVLGDVRLRWVAMAFILPQIVHRVFENLLIPVVAKKVLEDPSVSGWLLASSNLGELIGAWVLLKLASRFDGPSQWIKWSAIGLTLIWALALSKSLLILLPLILLSSATWSAGDLSLRSEVQGRVADKDQARATAFLYGAFVIGSALISMALGFLLDAVPLLHAIAITCAAFTALALGVYYASLRLKK
ncbi:MAG: MFS transporter [Elusimicrobiota bacterium]|nr:MAG: MFS transporter [Elusimicrobiota bacterium]